MNHARVMVAATAVLLSGTSGCALLSKTDPLTPRYFSPEPAQTPLADTALPAPRDGTAAPELRLGRVTAPSYLGERLVYRTSGYELGFYEDRRWTEKPDAFIRRSLSRALFEQGGIRRLVSGNGPTLDVELVEVTEVRTKAHVARVEATYILYDSRAVRTEETVAVELPIRTVPGDAQASEAVRALSECLSSVVRKIEERVRASLATSAAGVASGAATLSTPVKPQAAGAPGSANPWAQGSSR